MDSVSVWDEGAALQSCWLDCEAYPTSAYRSGKTPGLTLPCLSRQSQMHKLWSKMLPEQSVPKCNFVCCEDMAWPGTQAMTRTSSTSPATPTTPPGVPAPWPWPPDPWPHGHLAPWSPGHLAPWPPSHLPLWPPSHLATWPPGHLAAPLYRHPIFYFWLKLAPMLLIAKTSTGATFGKN